ncbi:MAG: hypothetical protein QNL88_16170 [Acidobacteriota bacterium]|nr:hypothetical protein [Acidobacteriota bacterium]
MRSLALVVAVAALGVAAATLCLASEPQATDATSNAVQALAFDVASHPNAEAVDIYKFLHQAMFGPGHAVTDPDQAGLFLRNELAAMGPATTNETWCDTLGGDPFLVRVNLRPFVVNGFDTDVLLETFVATANAVHGDPQQMGVALDLAVRWLPSEGKKDLSHELQQFAREMKQKGYPAVHHSAAYVQAYQPAYRVIEASMAATYGWCGSAF